MRDSDRDGQRDSEPAGAYVHPLDRLQPWELARVLRVLRVVAERTSVSPAELLGRGRTHRVARARHIAMFALKHHAGLSFSRLADIFGVVHTTAFNAVHDLEERARRDADLNRKLAALRAELQS